MNDCNPKDEIDFPPYQPEPVKYLSEEVKEAIGCEFPDIDCFQSSHAIIGIPMEYISGIIRKGNPVKLIGIPFSATRNAAEAFMHSFRALGQTPEDTIDCFTGIFVGKDAKINACDLKEFLECVAMLPEHINAVWGFYIVDDADPDFAQVITVVTKMREKEDIEDLP